MRTLTHALFLVCSLVACGGSESGGGASSSGGEGCYIETVDGETGCWADVDEACTFAQCDDCACTEMSGANSCSCGGGTADVEGGDTPVANDADAPSDGDATGEADGTAAEAPAATEEAPSEK